MPNDDYILRGDALKAIQECFDNEWEFSYDNAQSCAHRIERIPTADVEPVRHGRWMKMTGMMPPEFTGHYQCSECEWFCKKHSIKETDFDFCPGCGADMRKRKKDAE